MRLQSSQEFSSSTLRCFPKSIRNIALTVLASTQLLLAQDHGNKIGSLSEDLNFLHASDPSAESLNHSFSDNHHIHFGSEVTYSRNHATQDGNLERWTLAWLWLHAQIPLNHDDENPTLAKISAHGLVSTNSTDPLRHELLLDFGIIKNQWPWKFAGWLTVLHEVSQLPHTHTHTTLHDDGHGHITPESHTETTIDEHIYTGLGAYIDVARKIHDNVFMVLHLEHDESRTGSGSFWSLGVQAYKIPLSDRFHLDASGMFIAGEGERFKNPSNNGGDRNRGVCFMPSIALHYIFNPHSSIFVSWTGIIPLSQRENIGTAFTIGFSLKN